MISDSATQRLMDFIHENPNASDTAEGIARWWLRMPLGPVRSALEELVAAGCLERLERVDSVIYRAVRDPRSPLGV